jgi:hypothetical protein
MSCKQVLPEAVHRATDNAGIGRSYDKMLPEAIRPIPGIAGSSTSHDQV